MKRAILLSVLVVLYTTLFSQKDTTFYFQGNEINITSNSNNEINVRVHNSKMDSSETMLFEGTYNDTSSKEVNTSYAFSKFIKKTKVSLDPHTSGIYAGFSNLASRDLSIGNVKDAVLKYNSYEIGWTMFSVNIPLSNKYGWFFFIGAGFRVQQYNSDNNTAFRLDNNLNTCQIAAPTDIYYSTSKLTMWYFNVPLIFEYQKEITSSPNFYIQAGLDCGIKLTSKSKVKYCVTDDNKETKEFIGSNMNVNPITVDARVEIGFGDLGVYARYGLINTFRSNRGANVIPVAVGAIWHF